MCAAADDAATLLAARALAGIGYLLVVVAGPSLMAAIAEPRHQAVTLSLWGTFVPVGIALAGLATAGLWRRKRLAHDLRRRRAPCLPAPCSSPSWPWPAGRPAATDGGDVVGAAGCAPPCRRPCRSSASRCFSSRSPESCPPIWSIDRGLRDGATAGSIVAVATAFGIAGSFAAGWLMRRGMAAGRLAALGLVGLDRGRRPLPSATAVRVPLAVGRLRRLLRARRAGARRGLRLGAAHRSRANGRSDRSTACWRRRAAWDGWPVRRRLRYWVDWAGWSLAPLLLLAIAALGAAAALAGPRARRSGRAVLDHHHPELAGRPAGRANRPDRGSWSRCSSRCRRPPGRSRRARR